MAIYNITSAGAVDRESVYIVELTLDALWLLWVPLGSLWPSFGLPLTSFGSLGVPLGSLWPSFRVPLVVLGHLWDPCGESSGIC